MGLGLFRHYHVQALRVNENSQVQKWLLAMRGGYVFVCGLWQLGTLTEVSLAMNEVYISLAVYVLVNVTFCCSILPSLSGSSRKQRLDPMR